MLTKQVLCRSILLILLLGILASLAKVSAATSLSAKSWQLWRANKNLSVSYQAHDKSGLNIIKATLLVNSSLSGFMLFLQDTDNIPNWLENAKHSEVVKQLSPYENVFITHFNAVWPVMDRNMVIHSIYRQNADKSITIDVTDGANAVAPVANSIRMTIVKASWHITPLTKQQLRIEYQVLVDPNGDIPHWLSNKLALRSMWQTLQNIEQQLPKSRWQQQHLETISSP